MDPIAFSKKIPLFHDQPNHQVTLSSLLFLPPLFLLFLACTKPCLSLKTFIQDNLVFEFKEKIEYKRIKVLHRIFLKGCFCQGQGAHATV